MKYSSSYFALFKPYGILSQFSDKERRKTLKDIFDFPQDVYPVGRLDMDSEGLLLLTDDKELTDFLLNPVYKHEKEYYVQVEGVITNEALQNLCNGIIIEGKRTLPAIAKQINEPQFPKRIPPIRERKNIPTSWISLIITEGRNRQVRKMTAAVGFPTLRLVRVRIKNVVISKMKPGDVRNLTDEEISGLKRKYDGY